MKSLLLSLAIVLFFFTNGKAQLVADAGRDTTICAGANVLLGGNPTATGGTSPYFYGWSPTTGLNNTFIANPTTSLTSSTTYFLTVTDSLGLQASDTVIITVMPSPIIVSVGVNDTVGCTTTVFTFTPNVSGGSMPYSYDWFFQGITPSNFNGQSPPGVSYTLPGNFMTTLNVTDSNGCSGTSSALYIHVLQSCNGFSVSQQNPTCFGTCNATGKVTSTIPGNYHYLWSNGDTTASAFGLCAAGYTVTVMDAAFTPLDTLTLNIALPIPFTTITSDSNVTCFGAANGAAALIVTGGGSPPYAYLWSNGSTTQVQQNLSAGIYTVTVFDYSQCSTTNGVTITQPAPLNIAEAVSNETTQGACDGSITVTVSGGTPPYTYLGSNIQTTLVIPGLCPGIYTAPITDANGCSATASAYVAAACPNNTLVVSISSTGNIDCSHSADTLTANISGGTLPYYYYWSTGDTAQTKIVTQAGVYVLYATDSAGCGRTVADTVMNLGLVLTLQNINSVACNGISNGLIRVGVSGGVPPYTYLWSNAATTDSISSIPSGTYSVTVTDAAQCTVSFSYFLNQASTNWSYYVYASSTASNCSSNGSATAIVQGGTPPYSYLWNTTPPQTTPTATGLTGGTYVVTVTGSDGCLRTGNAYINTSCYNIIEGYAFNDTNGNCVKDSGEATLSNINVIASNGNNTYYGYSNNNGFYTINVGTSGNYNVNASIYNGYGNCSNVNVCGTQTASFSGLGDTSVLNVGFSGSSGFNLALHPGWHSANPGFTKDYWVLYYQTSLPTYTGPATIIFKYDSILIFQSCNNGGVNDPVAHTITWNVSSVPYPSWDWNTVPRAYFTLPANTPLNYQLSQEFWLTPTNGDCDATNNHVQVTELTTGSRDPNEKDVQPAGDVTEEDSVLTYTIHFQNTGNDTAWFIIVKDTLSPNLDPATVQNLSSSHDYSSFTISDRGILTWVFNPIYLVDSATNEPASKGYVMFKVKKKAGLQENTTISNTASIYFDYNDPVMTNTVIDTVTLPLSIYSVQSDQSISVTAMPNPFTQTTQMVVSGVNGTYDFELFDVTGKLIKKISSLNENHFELNRESMSAGVYFYRITTTSKQRVNGRVVVE